MYMCTGRLLESVRGVRVSRGNSQHFLARNLFSYRLFHFYLQQQSTKGSEHGAIKKAFAYSRLKENYIMILSIPPSRAETRLQLRLEDVPLSNTGEYMALSYAWDNQPIDVSVAINGKHTQTSRTVYEAIWRLQNVSSEVRIWIDSICINEADAKGKTPKCNSWGKYTTHLSL